MGEARNIQLRIRLAGGLEHTLMLREDAPELLALFSTAFGLLSLSDLGLD